MRRIILVVAIALTAVVSSLATLAVAHHGEMHKGVYKKTWDAPRFFPYRVVVRCPGAAEDTWSKLFLVDVRGQGEPGAGDDVYVYRCNLSV